MALELSPKEKAINILNEMFAHIPNNLEDWTQDDAVIASKLCAKVCVNVIINEFDNVFKYEDCKKTEDKKKYWNEVNKELNKL